jgi:hypothetical protein
MMTRQYPFCVEYRLPIEFLCQKQRINDIAVELDFNLSCCKERTEGTYYISRVIHIE